MKTEPQINADERKFVDLKIQRFSKVCPANSFEKSQQSTQRAQNSAIQVSRYEKGATSRFRTRMTEIARIFADIVDQFASPFHSTDNKPQRSQRTQSIIANLCAFHVIYGRLTLFTAWLTRIYQYPCASASSVQSVFYCTPSSFCVHPQQILSMKEKAAAFYYALINKANTIFNQKSDINDRHLLLQRT